MVRKDLTCYELDSKKWNYAAISILLAWLVHPLLLFRSSDLAFNFEIGWFSTIPNCIQQLSSCFRYQLMLFMRMLPGGYVAMFEISLRRYFKVFQIYLLAILGFGISFYVLRPDPFPEVENLFD